MAKLKIDQEKCKGCLLCISACPKGLLKPSRKLNSKGFNFVEFTSSPECAGCALCAVICGECCIEVYK